MQIFETWEKYVNDSEFERTFLVIQKSPCAQGPIASFLKDTIPLTMSITIEKSEDIDFVLEDMSR